MNMPQTNNASVSRLRDSVQSFVARMRQIDPTSSTAYSQVGSLMYSLTEPLAMAEKDGLTREEILNTIEDGRAVFAESLFGRRMQTWPRGYPGDFETVEWMTTARVSTTASAIGRLIEWFFLNRSICQQHRNKIAYQAKLISQCAENGPQSILLVASGSALDLQSVWYRHTVRRSHFVLNDSDPDALAAAKQSLRDEDGGITFIPGNALALSGTIAEHGPYDLIITGGLFDYLDERAAKLLIRLAFTKWLRPGGMFYFSNIGKGNPYRYWMEYLEDWILLERDEADVHALIEPLKDDVVELAITRDLTGLALLVTARRSERTA